MIKTIWSKNKCPNIPEAELFDQIPHIRSYSGIVLTRKGLIWSNRLYLVDSSGGSAQAGAHPGKIPNGGADPQVRRVRIRAERVGRSARISQVARRFLGWVWVDARTYQDG
jgi:hypothetical protein